MLDEWLLVNRAGTKLYTGSFGTNNQFQVFDLTQSTPAAQYLAKTTLTPPCGTQNGNGAFSLDDKYLYYGCGASSQLVRMDTTSGVSVIDTWTTTSNSPYPGTNIALVQLNSIGT